MERSLIINDASLGGLDPRLPAEFDSLYYGDEFCQVKLPGIKGIRSLAKRFPGKKIIFLTSVLTQHHLELAVLTARKGFSEGCLSEVVVNDLGLLERLARGCGGRMKITIGRVLVYTLQFSLGSPFFLDFMRKNGIDTFEADSAESCEYLPRGKNLRCNLHLPYRYLSQTRFCRFINGFNARCGYECGDRLTPVKTGITENMFLKGNAYLQSNSGELARAREIAGAGRIKRLVVTPDACRDQRG